MRPGDIVNEYVERLIRAKYRKLEEEGAILLKMGYTPEELTVVQHPNGSSEVSPESALEELG